MAYASLVSLSEILDKILKNDGLYNIIIDDEKQPIESLHEKVIFLEEFLEDFPEKSRKLEVRIGDVINEIQCIIESFISSKIRSVHEGRGAMEHLYRFIFCVRKNVQVVHSLYENLQNETKEIDCIVEEVIKMKESVKNKDGLPVHSSSSASSSISLAPDLRKGTMVEFDGELMEIENWLSKSYSKNWVIAIVGRNGIEILHKILERDGLYNIIDDAEKQPIESLPENIKFLEEFLEDFPEKAKNLQGRTNEDIIESYFSTKIQSVSTKHLWLFILCVQNCLIAGSHEQTKRYAGELSIHSSPFASSSAGVAPPIKDDLLEVKDRLCGLSSEVQIIPIVGMGGIGKTTLAKKAYEDARIVQSFDVRAWVTVSQDYRAREFFQSFLRSMGASQEEIREEINDELLREKVHKTLKGRRYLIVMDDMWSTNVWDDVQRFFPSEYNGSRIIVTTRLSDVASYAGGSTSIHEMQFMDVNRSWNLLREKVFGQEDCPVEFEKVGKMIARNCHGLPLAIVVVGGILSKVNQSLHDWENVAKNIRGAINEGGVAFENILALSYDHLPHHLKPCFLYFGGFPEDYEIHVSKLAKLWVAEGILKTSDSKSLEDVAQDYMEDLVRRNMVLVIRKSYNGKSRRVKIHDLLRDLCLNKCREENFFYHVCRLGQRHPKRIRNVQRLSMDMCPNTFDQLLKNNCTSVRTVLKFKRNVVSIRWLQTAILLRVLFIDDTMYHEFPVEIESLFHLRFLACSFSIFESLKIRASISNFHNLETLIIDSKWSGDEMHLPVEVWKFRKLRHLILYVKGFLPHPGGDDGALINLQTLSYVANFVLTKRIIKRIPNLKKLGLDYFREGEKNVWSRHHISNLVDLRQLEKLKLRVDWNLFEDQSLFSFPSNLKTFTLTSSSVPLEVLKVIGSLPNLEVLKLKNFALFRDEWETTEGEFCKLKKLEIEVAFLRRWIVEDSTHFPRLEQLMLFRCDELTEIPPAVGEIPTLQMIELDGGCDALIQSAKRIQEEQQSYGNYVLQVRVRN